MQSWVAFKSVYRCWYNWSRGPAVCTNTLTVRQDRADNDRATAVERDVLDREVVEAGLFISLQHLSRSDDFTTRRRDELRDELARIETELARYANAIADAGPLDTILAAIHVREERRDAIRHELRALTPQRPGAKEPGEIRATLSRYLGDWTAMVRGSVAEARRVLRDVLIDRLVFRPVPRPPELPPVKGPGRRAKLVYEVAGEASLSKVFAELVYVSSVVAPTGPERTYRIQLRDIIAR